jgi:preprotein translocase subunit SecY
MYKKYAILILLFAGVSKMLNAQTQTAADKLMDGGKINAVIVIAAVLLAGIFLFLVYLERRLKKLEEEVNN